MAGEDQYLSTQVLTATPYRLHFMVVDGAIRFAKLALDAMRDKDMETTHLALSQSRDFVAEMLGGLKEDYDKELTARMKQLFFFAYASLVEGERDRDAKKVEDALIVLKLHQETWVELGTVLKSHPTAESPTKEATGQPRAWSA